MHLRLRLLPGLLMLAACGSETPVRPGVIRAEADALAAPADGPGPARLDDAGKAALTSAVARIAPAELGWEDAWAFAHCACVRKLTGRYLTALGEARGALPEVLVPSIRREIRNDATLISLLQFAGGAFKGAVELLVGKVLGDEGLADKIRSGLTTKFKKALGLGADAVAPGLEQTTKFRFDLFPAALARGAVLATALLPTTFEAREQAARAAWIFALPDLWSGARNGAILLETARVMAEWRYVIGDADPASGAVDGGLLFDPEGGLAPALAPLDQGAGAAAIGAFSGSYSVKFHQAAALDVALNVAESWTRAPATVALDEQAILAAAAARAFSRLKPSRRGAVALLFAPDSGVFPENAHALPLALLASVSRLLTAGFIDEEARSVRQFAALPGTPAELTTAPATLASLARALRALTAWHEQLETLDPADVPAEAGTTLDGAAEKLLRGAQLLTSVILRDHAAEAGDAETLAALAEANTSLFKSAFLSDKLAVLAKSLRLDPDSPRALAWTLTAVRALKRDPGTHNLGWLDDAETELQTLMEAPDAR